MDKVNGDEASIKPCENEAHDHHESPSTSGGNVNVSSKVDKEVIDLEAPGPDSVIMATMNPNQLWLIFSECEGAKDAREDVVTLVKQLQFLNGPQGQQIFSVFEQLMLDWATVLEELTRAEGNFARDKELPGNPQIVIRVGMTAVKKFKKVASRYRAILEMSISFESIFAKAEAFNLWLSNDTKTVGGCAPEPEVKNPADKDENPKLSKYPLHSQQLKILEEAMTRMEALTVMINQKLVQMGVN